MSSFSCLNYWTYILQSKTSGRYYCGSTGDLKRRIAGHNSPDYEGARTTKRFKGPWELVWYHRFPTRSEAMIKEKAIKKRGIGRFLEDCAQLVESPLNAGNNHWVVSFHLIRLLPDRFESCLRSIICLLFPEKQVSYGEHFR